MRPLSPGSLMPRRPTWRTRSGTGRLRQRCPMCEGPGSRWRISGDSSGRHKRELDSIDVVIREGEGRHCWKKLETQVEDIYVTSSVPQLLEISYKEAGKASGVRFLLDHLKIAREHLAAFGDGDNDSGMLRLAGIGVAVANAVPGCLAAADRITGSNDEDGVAAELERMLAEL